MDAEKIKKKLHGSILKGTKVRVETARPVVERVAEEPADAPKKPKKEKHKKRKRDELVAVDIGERQVKRGWTVPATLVSKEKEKKKGMVNKSKFTTAPECLFKTILPPNVASKEVVKDAKPVRGGSTKGKEAVVHEFTKATKYATFLRTSSGSSKKKTVSEFVKGKGWVDEDGNVVEAVKGGIVTATKKPGLDDMDVDESESSSDEEVSAKAEVVTEPTKVEETAPLEKTPEPAEDSSSDDSSSDESSSSEGEEEEAKAEPTPKVTEKETIAPESSSSESSSEDDVEEGNEDEAPTAPETPTGKKTSPPPPASSDSDSSDSDSDSEGEASPSTKAASRPQSSSGHPHNLSIKIPPTPPTTTIHPLEALYKRNSPSTTSTPATKPTAKSAFSFFGADNDSDAEMEDSQPQVPLTPFTQKDFEFRGMRSAAPTPDTAHANKRFIWPTDEDDEDEDGEEPDAASTPSASKSKAVEEGKGGADETDFQKWFYEHRGEANRAWKKRRKVVAKEVRQRENRKRQERI